MRRVVASDVSDMPTACFTAIMFAVPPIQLPESEASGFQPSPGIQWRKIR